MSRTQVNLYTCQLRLLQYGLTQEVSAVEAIGSAKGAKSKRAKNDGDDSDNDEEDDDESVMDKRNTFVRESIKQAKKEGCLLYTSDAADERPRV